jgi:sugar/nucleoside kinase (ribokinase family)
VFLPSGVELYLFTNAKQEKAAIAQILDQGVGAIVHKRGADGASYFDVTTQLIQPAFKVEEVDPTGAGDSFGATFVSCWLRDMPAARCLAYAAASGALAVTRQGPMEGAASQADLDVFLAVHSRRLSC